MHLDLIQSQRRTFLFYFPVTTLYQSLRNGYLLYTCKCVITNYCYNHKMIALNCNSNQIIPQMPHSMVVAKKTKRFKKQKCYLDIPPSLITVSQVFPLYPRGQ